MSAKSSERFKAPSPMGACVIMTTETRRHPLIKRRDRTIRLGDDRQPSFSGNNLT